MSSGKYGCIYEYKQFVLMQIFLKKTVYLADKGTFVPAIDSAVIG